MSTLTLESLLAFKESASLHLCQEFIWHNPARLPSPVQWVNIDRIRVKGQLHEAMVAIANKSSQGQQSCSPRRV